MGITCNGQLCWGILLDNDVELPWDQEAYDYDLGTWWVDKACRYQPPEEVYDDQGEPLPGIPQESIKDYWERRRVFEEAHPCPVEVVDDGSEDDRTTILAVPGGLGNHWGFPVEVKDVVIPPVAEIRALGEFCVDHLGLDVTTEDVKLWLSSCFLT